MAGDKGSDGNLGGTPPKGAGGQDTPDLFADLFGPNTHFDTSNLKAGDAAKDSTVIDSLSSYRTAEASPVESTSNYTALTGRADTVPAGSLPEVSFFHEEPQPEDSTYITDSNTESVLEQSAMVASDKSEADFKPREYASSSRRDMIGSIERVGAVSEPARDHLANLSQRFSNAG